MEYILIKVLLNLEYYNKFFSYLKLDFYKDNSKEIYKIFLCLKSLQERESRDYDVASLSLHFFSEYPFLKPDDTELYKAIFQKIEEVIVDYSLVYEYLQKQRQQALASQVAILSLDVAQGRKDWSEVTKLVTNEEGDVEEDQIEFVSDDLKELYNATVVQQGLRWRLNTLNRILGSLRKGDFGFIFARPETGKTTFLASEISYMAEQTDRPILWFNNEEQGSKVTIRCYQAALGLTTDDLFNDLDNNQNEYYRLTKRNIKIYDDATISRSTVERVCKAMSPALIIFDQIDKISGFDAERHDLKLKTIYQWARELAKQYGPTIGVCQAGGTGEGKKYLSMSDVDSSHTAKQGEADFILGIGMTNNDGEEYVRYLSTCKNKLSGDVDSIPELRHGKVAVNIFPETARYSDIQNWD